MNSIKRRTSMIARARSRITALAFAMPLMLMASCADSEPDSPAKANAVPPNQSDAAAKSGGVSETGASHPEEIPRGYIAMGHGRKPIPPPEQVAKLPPDGGPEYNRLVFQHSPYLLQHAGNPVDWFPWGEEAFRKAKEEDKPIFLSVGYSTCHWCHVMEEESFEDPEVAALMNANFICIKVDREERPDVDQIYMSVTQAMTGSGGWPMTVVMTPDRVPYFAGTYFPKEGRFGRQGMMQIVPALGDAWKTQREKVLATAGQIQSHLSQSAAGTPGDTLGIGALDLAYRQLAGTFDARRGGFGSAPKFPTPHNFLFLLRYWRRTGDARALEIVEKTLTEMRRGGIFDQVGFGFHRYSTDPDWLLPHFEKMLYDQAMLVMAYTETFQATRKSDYADAAREIIAYVLRDMTSPEGGFYSAEDADSEGEEGLFYVWTAEEAEKVLGSDDGKLFARIFNFEGGGNFREQSTGQKTGANIPHLSKSLAEWAVELKTTEPELRERIETWRTKLFDTRERRIHPFKDDKILTDWNGLMIAALAKAACAFDEPKYADAARRVADFVLASLRDEKGRLLKRFRRGEAGLPAHLEDYAFMVFGLTELYEATFEIRYLEEALALNKAMLDLFWDEAAGGFYLTASDSEKLLVRPKEVYDGAIPSGNSVAALNLLRLGRITGNTDFEARADKLFRAFSGDAARAPSAHSFLMTAVDFAAGTSFEIVIAGSPGAADVQTMKKALDRQFIPNKVVIFRPEMDNPPISKIAEFTAAQKSIEGKATAYVCQNYACKAPTTDAGAMIAAIEQTMGAAKRP